MRMLAARRAPGKDHKEATDAANQPLPTWTDKELKAIQTELIRLGLYRATADGDLGAGTQSALVEAFGSDEWRAMDGATCLTKLKAAKPPPGAKGDKPGQHDMRYGEMFKDGVLDMTLALGFDEGGLNKAGLKNLLGRTHRRGLRARRGRGGGDLQAGRPHARRHRRLVRQEGRAHVQSAGRHAAPDPCGRAARVQPRR